MGYKSRSGWFIEHKKDCECWVCKGTEPKKKADRSKKLVSLIGKVYEANPHLRLGQIIFNALPPCTDIFYLEDSELEKLLRRHYNEKE